MRVVRPMALTINSTTVANTAYATYSSGTTYALGVNVSATDATGATNLTHEYESLQASNVGNALTDPAYWLDLGPTNRHRMFDSKTGTATTATGSMTVNLSPGDYFDTLALVGLDNVETVEITVSRSGDELFSETLSLAEDYGDWWDYFFAPVEEWRTKLVWSEEVWYATSDITITLTGPVGETIGCGMLLIGSAEEYGLTLYGVSVSIEDYSTKETDPFGNTYLLERAYADRADCQIIMERAQSSYVKRKLAALRATPALYDLNNQDGTDDGLIIFGKYDDFSINYENHSKSYCSLSLLELI